MRVVHTLIHTGSNRLPRRAIVFTIGAACLFFMWVGIVMAII